MHWRWGWTPVFFTLTEGEICEITGPAAQLTEDWSLKVSGRFVIFLNLCSLVLVLFHADCFTDTYIPISAWQIWYYLLLMFIFYSTNSTTPLNWDGWEHCVLLWVQHLKMPTSGCKWGSSTLSYASREQQQILNFFLWSSPSAGASPPLHPVMFIIDCSLYRRSKIIV